MPRDIDATLLAALDDAIVQPRFFLEIQLSDASYIRYWTGEIDSPYDSKTWQANGFFKNFDQLKESQDGFDGITVDLMGEPSALLSIALSSLQRNRVGRLLVALVNDGNAVIGAPVEFRGRLDAHQLVDGVAESTLRLKFESDLIRLNDTTDRRFTNESQKIDYSLDLGFEYVPQLQNLRQIWGKKASSTKKRRDKEGKARTPKRGRGQPI